MHSVGSRKHSPQRRKAEPPRARLGRCWLVGTALCILFASSFGVNESLALDKTNYYRQWAFIQLNNVDEFYCLDVLYYHESRWNPRAVSPSGKHFGIPQGRSKWLATVDGIS